MTVFLASIGFVTLSLGGIGVMNIMLVTVTERTREIGLRKASGRTRRRILMDFLVEGVSWPFAEWRDRLDALRFGLSSAAEAAAADAGHVSGACRSAASTTRAGRSVR